MIIKNFINGQITTGTEPIDPISGVSRGLYINSVLSGNSSSDTLVGLDINPSYSGIAGNYFGLRVSGDTIFATSGGTQVFRTNNSGVAITGTLSNTTGAQFATSSGNVLIGTTTDAGQRLQVNGTSRFLNTLTGTSATFTGTIIAGQNDGNNYNHAFNGGLGTITFTRFDSYINPNFVVITQPNYGMTADGSNLLVTHNTNNKASGSAIAKIKGTISGAGSSILEVGSGTNSVNSSHTSVLKVYSNGMDYFGPTYSGLKYIGLDVRYQGSTADYGTTSGTSVVSLYIQSNFTNNYSSTYLPLDSWKGLHENSVFSYLITPYTALDITPTFTNTIPNTLLIGLNIQPSLGGYTGFTAIQSVVGNVNLNVLSGTTNIGTSGSTGFKLFVSGSTLLRGSGTTSSSSALTVQNSSGGTLLNLTNNGNLNVDNGALYVDGDNGRVGIGTSSPTSKLYLDGGLFTKKYYTDTSNNTINFGSAYELFGTLHGSSGYSFFINPTGWASGWNVKIGNTTTSFDFDYSGGFTAFKVNADALSLGGGQLSFYKSSPDTGWSYASAGGWSFVIRGSDDEKLRITSGGNVLIGTTTDLGFKLSVSGSTLLRGSGTTSASYALATQNSSGGTTMVVNNAGNMLIGTTTDAGYKLDVNGTTRLGNLTLANGGILLGDVGGTRVFNTAGLAIDYGALYPFSITGSGTITITPAGILTLKGVTHTYSATETYVVQKTTHIGHLQINFDISGSDATAYNYGTISGNVRIYPGEQSNGNGYGNVILAHNGINERGSVLIGTSTTNNSRLLVGGTVSGATLSTTRAVHINPTLLATGNTTTLIGLDIQPRYSIGSYTGLTQIALRVSGGTQIIGSGSTGTTLSLFSVDGASGRLFDVTDDFTNSLFSVNTSSGVPVIEAFANNSIVMGTYGSNALVVSGRSTYFGVIPSDSNYRIISSGATLFSGGTMVIKGSGTTSGSIALSVQNSSGGTLMNLFDNGNLNIDNGVLYVNGDTGNVGIGTSNPVNKLHISGSAGDIVYIVANTGQSAVIGATGSGTNRMYIGYSPGTENISITSSNVVRLNPSGSGNVLIGTTTDSGHNLNVNGTSNFSGNMTLGGTATLGSTVVGSSGIAIGDGSSRGTWTVGVGYAVNMTNVSQALGVGSGVAWLNNSINVGAGSYNDSTSSKMAIAPMGMSATTLSSGATSELYISERYSTRLSIPDISVINAMVTVDYIATCTLTGSSSSLVYNDVKAGTQKFYVKRWFINNVGAYFTISTPVDVYSQSDSAMSGATLSYEYVSASTIKVKFNAPPTASGSTFTCAATARITTY